MTLKHGDTVKVKLPDGWFTGKVTKLEQNPWTGERRVLVSGNKPSVFITSVRESSAVLVEAA